MSRTYRSVAALLVLMTIPPLVAQEAPLPKLVETMNIRVINVDVVVTDRKGKTISGLQMKDFQVYENGKPQNLTNFYEVNGRVAKTEAAPAPPIAPPAPLPTRPPAPVAAPAETRGTDSTKRKIIFFVDNLSLNPLNRNNVFKSMKKFAQETMRTGDEAMIATWNRSMKIRVPFTRDPAQIVQELDGISRESASGSSNLSDRRQTETRIRDERDYDAAVATARSYAQSVDHDLRQTVSALNGLMATLAGVEGKKIMVLTSEGFPMQPGREMFVFIDDVAREKPNWQRGSSLTEAMMFDGSQLIGSVARTANANGITLYTLHAGGLGATMEGSAENREALSLTVQQAALANSTDSLRMLADLTGGLAAVGTNNFAGAFSRIGQDLDSYYSLGYRSSTERIDRQRSIQVKVRNKDYVVRSRRTFVEKSVPTEMNDRVIANLFYPNRANDLKIVFKTGMPASIDGERFKVPLEIHIPMDSLTLVPQGEMLIGGFAVYIGVADLNGDMSDINQQSHRVTVPQSDAGKAKGKDYVYSVDLIMLKGLNKISIGVVDEISNTTGFDRRSVIVKDLR